MQEGNIEKFYNKCAGNPLEADILTEGGLSQVVKQIVSPRKVQKNDTRVTGSELIDTSLQEILGYIIRDYISPWYNLISRDTDFTNVTLKRTAQTFAINISNRYPYLPMLCEICNLIECLKTRLSMNEKLSWNEN